MQHWIIFCFFHTFLLLSFQRAEAEKPEFIIEPYLQQLNESSFHVMWETSVPAQGFVRLGIAEFNVLKPQLGKTFGKKGFSEFHSVSVTGLQTGGAYFYQAYAVSLDSDTLFGPVTPLNIPDYPKMPVTFTVVGDTQNSPIVWGKIARLMLRERPSFIVHVGDMVQYGPHKVDWYDEFFRPASELFRFYPLYPAIGNHEMNHPWFYQYFNLPPPEWFYTVKKGDALFIFADTNKDILPGSEQYRRLEKILASSGEKWKIMVHHHPVYTSSEDAYGNTWFQTQVHGDPNVMQLKTLYGNYAVDLVLNGHMHMYERTWPLFRENVDYDNGVVYVTTGGGGGKLDQAGINRTWYAARTRSCHHFLSISITDNVLFANAIDTLGTTFDSWTITKESIAPNAPYFSGYYPVFIKEETATIRNLNNEGTLFYSLDGISYKKAISNEVQLPVNAPCTISAYVSVNGVNSRIIEKSFTQLVPFTASHDLPKKLRADYYEGDWTALPDFEKLKPLKSFYPDSVSLEQIRPRANDHFAVRFTGSFIVPETAVYRLFLESFDGSRILIDGKEIIDNDGMHYEIKKENFIALEKGLHHFEIQYFDYIRRETLRVLMGFGNEAVQNFNHFLKND